MSDPDAMLSVGSHAAGAGGAGVVVATLMRWFQSRESHAVRTDLALLAQQVASLAVTLEKHAGIGERVALVEQSLAAVHRRIDELGARRRR